MKGQSLQMSHRATLVSDNGVRTLAELELRRLLVVLFSLWKTRTAKSAKTNSLTTWKCGIRTAKNRMMTLTTICWVEIKTASLWRESLKAVASIKIVALRWEVTRARRTASLPTTRLRGAKKARSTESRKLQLFLQKRERKSKLKRLNWTQMQMMYIWPIRRSTSYGKIEVCHFSTESLSLSQWRCLTWKWWHRFLIRKFRTLPIIKHLCSIAWRPSKTVKNACLKFIGLIHLLTINWQKKVKPRYSIKSRLSSKN